MKKRIYVSKEYNNFFVLPTLRVYWDRVYEGPLESVAIEFVWLRWSICIDVLKN
jgi:hypothetical protein